MSEDTYINPYYARIKELEQQNKQLQKELNQLLHNPDFAHQRNCGICGTLVSKALDDISCINVKGSRLTWVCDECDNLKQKLELSETKLEKIEEWVNDQDYKMDYIKQCELKQILGEVE